MTGVSLSVTSVTLDTVTNNVYHVQATVFPLEANNKKMVWTSSNPTVATVDQTGNVTALSDGSATLTVTTVEGSYQASVNIFVDTP
ncbi:Ig-like domain-containing protein [Paenibacillus frigoriresistens]|nr:Ig-like domain-containing protein [Paenibacillus frigoriresistens]